MKIEQATMPDDGLRGRPSTYPFKELLPGTKLTVPCDEDGTQEYLRKKVGSALYQYKKSNNLIWQTAIRVEDGNVCVYRKS